MTTVLDLLETIKAIDLSFEIEESINNTKEKLLDKQKDQLLHGLKADGTIIGRYKNEQYAAMKYAANPLAGFGNMDWKLTGDLHKDLFVDVRKDSYIIDSADSKTGKLIEEHGDPFDLTKDRKEEYVEDSLEDEFYGRMNKATGL